MSYNYQVKYTNVCFYTFYDDARAISKLLHCLLSADRNVLISQPTGRRKENVAAAQKNMFIWTFALQILL